MFGFIKKLINGILAFLGGLFGGKKSEAANSGNTRAKKSSGYFLELDEAQGNGQPAKAASATKTEAAPAKAEATPVKAEAAPAKVEAAPAQPAKAEPVKAASPSNNGAKPAIAPAPTPAPTTAAFASTASVPNNFGGRRRPGPNMGYFMDLARQAKVPS